jgi:membrane-associated phospholipid phosphatase
VALAELLIRLVAVEAVLIAVATVVCIGRESRSASLAELRDRLRSVAPQLAFLAGVLALNKAARQVGPQVSWLVNLNVTDEIYALEGAFVANLQTVATPELTAYLAFAYVYGYTFLLVFPLVAYVLDDVDRLSELTVAFALNYAIGLAAYVLFVSYGPRNLIPDLVEPLLYGTYPVVQILTSEVNARVNVFPSLHTSLSATVLWFAWLTREQFPRWLYVAAPLALSVIFSTMYLGIHWATDVVAGLALAAVSVVAARRAGWQRRAIRRADRLWGKLVGRWRAR